MKHIKTLLLAIATLLTISLFAQKASITAGPMLGYMEHRETLIWLQTQCAKKVTLEYWIGDKPTKNQIFSSTKHLCFLL